MANQADGNDEMNAWISGTGNRPAPCLRPNARPDFMQMNHGIFSCGMPKIRHAIFRRKKGPPFIRIAGLEMAGVPWYEKQCSGGERGI